jgi:8-oxo-dGTP pyrophosphatase MutT (NUDIX family)
MKHSSRWDLPKGHLDKGETAEQAALRELEEETGIGPHQIWTDPDFRFDSFYQVRWRERPKKLVTKQLTIFLGWLIEDVDIRATEHLGHEWFDWDPPRVIQLQTIDPLLEKVRSHLDRQLRWPNLPSVHGHAIHEPS